MRQPFLSQDLFTYKYDGDLNALVKEIEAMELAPNSNNLRSETSNILDKSAFSEFRVWVEAKLSDTAKELGYEFFLRITQSWFNKAEVGMWHHRHSHANSFISGIFYLTPSGSQTWFSMPGIWPRAHDDLSNISHFPFFGWYHPKTQEVLYRFPTEPGTLVLFPSHLDHSVNEHDLEYPRYTISFNTFPWGVFGAEEGYSLLDVKL